MNGIRRYQDLNGLKLCAADKIWVVETCEKQSAELSQRDFCRRHGLPQSTFATWKQKRDLKEKTGVDTFHEERGRPRLVDHTSGIDLQLWVDKRRREQNCVSTAEWSEQFHVEMEKTQKRRVTADHPARPQPKMLKRAHSSTRDDYKQQYDFSTVKAQQKPNARVFAEADPRNAFSMAVMCKAWTEDLDPSMIFNWDATQFVISPDGNCEVMYCKVKKNDDLPMTQKSAGGVKFAIKLYHYHNAAGAIAPPVFVIADETMDAEAFSAHRIAGLSTNNANGHGWVVFAKTRNGNAAFYEWFAREIVIPFVNNSRTHNGLEAVRIRTHFCIRSLPSAVLSVSMTSSSTPTHNTLRSCTLFFMPVLCSRP
jgi:hypothetical protein